MNKTHRKELELRLVKTIEEVLSKQNAEAVAKIRKTTVEACKLIAKKFSKTLKQKTEVTIKTKPVKKSLKKKVSTKTAVKKLKTVKKANSKK
jgi:hypothetical protein